MIGDIPSRVAVTCLAFLSVTAGLALAAPELTCDEPEYDFGTRTGVTNVVHTFVITNEGKTELKLGTVRTGCGCVVARLGRNVLESGEKTQLIIEFDLRGRRGKQRTSIS